MTVKYVVIVSYKDHDSGKFLLRDLIGDARLDIVLEKVRSIQEEQGSKNVKFSSILKVVEEIPMLFSPLQVIATMPPWKE